MNYPTQTLAAPLAMTSIEIAELTGKQHAHVLRDIRELVHQLRDDPNMDHTEIPGISIESDVRGYMAKAQLDKEMTLTLLTGYDAKARLRVIRRWQELEAGHTPTTYIAALEALVVAEKAKEAALLQAQTLTQQITAERPLVELAKALTSDSTITRREWLGLMKDDSGLNLSEHELTQFLLDQGYCYRDQIDQLLRAYAQYSRFLKLEVVPINGRARMLLKVTGEGVAKLTPIVLQYFAQRLEA